MKKNIPLILPYITVCVVVVMLLSLHFGWLNSFFFSAEHANVQGIDYFAVPKSFLNLLEKRSLFDTWGGTPYGPYATWYLAHPAFTVFVASWFSFFQPWTSYWLFTLFSVGLFSFSAYLIARCTDRYLFKQLSYIIIFCAFPTYWVLYTGNMHAPLVLALTLLLTGIYDIIYGDAKKGNQKLFIGLLISLFTKPIVLLMIPMLLILKETRKSAVKSLLIYTVVSLLFLIVPILNPEGIGWSKMESIALNFDFIKQNMNIYQNHFVLNEFMKDNSIHWLNLIAQSDYKLMHIDIFSLPVFVDTIVGYTTSSSIYKLPIYISLLLSVLTALIPDRKLRLECAMSMIMAISLTFFLSYNTVWEYQFSSVLPLIALLPILKQKGIFFNRSINLMLLLGIFIQLPSLYFFVRNGNYESNNALTLIRITRVIPVLIIFIIFISEAGILILKQATVKRIKELKPAPEKLFFD